MSGRIVLRNICAGTAAGMLAHGNLWRVALVSALVTLALGLDAIGRS